MNERNLTQVEALSIAADLKNSDNVESPLTESEQKRIERLQKYIAKVEESQKVMLQAIQRGDFEAFSEEDVRFHLSHDPDMIAEAGLFLAKLQRSYEYAKLDTATILAELWKICNSEKESLGLSSAKDRESWVKTQPKYIKAQRQEIEWRYHLDRMKIIYDRYENLFTGSRKIANLIEKDNENNYRREKYDE
jgi:hypothetical protein